MDYGSIDYGKTLYGDLYANADATRYEPDLLSYLPPFYSESPTFANVMTADKQEVGKFKVSIADLLKQCYIDTATWGLKFWEELLGIPVDEQKPVEHRRAVVKSKVRGSGTTTKDMIKLVASAFSGGDVEIIEHPKDSWFEVKFVGVRGVPPNLMDLTDTLNEIKPAHLGFEYLYSYLTYAEALTYTWAEAKVKTWSMFSTSRPKV